MEIQHKRWRKPLLLGSAVLLLLIGADNWYTGSGEEVRQRSSPVQENKQEKGNKAEIRGFQQASGQQELKNPFTWLHETEQESVAAVLPEQQPPAEKSSENREISPLHVDNGQKVRGQSDGSAAVVLCGIVESKDERLALLRVGNNTITVGKGEMAADWQVTGISTNTVTVERAGQVRSLSLTTHEGTGAQS